MFTSLKKLSVTSLISFALTHPTAMAETSSFEEEISKLQNLGKQVHWTMGGPHLSQQAANDIYFNRFRSAFLTSLPATNQDLKEGMTWSCSAYLFNHKTGVIVNDAVPMYKFERFKNTEAMVNSLDPGPLYVPTQSGWLSHRTQYANDITIVRTNEKGDLLVEISSNSFPIASTMATSIINTSPRSVLTVRAYVICPGPQRKNKSVPKPATQAPAKTEEVLLAPSTTKPMVEQPPSTPAVERVRPRIKRVAPAEPGNTPPVIEIDSIGILPEI